MACDVPPESDSQLEIRKLRSRLTVMHMACTVATDALRRLADIVDSNDWADTSKERSELALAEQVISNCRKAGGRS